MLYSCTNMATVGIKGLTSCEKTSAVRCVASVDDIHLIFAKYLLLFIVSCAIWKFCIYFVIYLL